MCLRAHFRVQVLMFLLVDREKGLDLFDCTVPYTEPITGLSLCIHIYTGIYIYIYMCVFVCVSLNDVIRRQRKTDLKQV